MYPCPSANGPTTALVAQLATCGFEHAWHHYVSRPSNSLPACNQSDCSSHYDNIIIYVFMQEPCSLRPNCHSSCLWSCCSFSGRRHKEDVLVVLAMDAVKLGSHKGIWLVNCLRIVCKLCWFQRRISYDYHVNNLLYAVTVISALIT